MTLTLWPVSPKAYNWLVCLRECTCKNLVCSFLLVQETGWRQTNAPYLNWVKAIQTNHLFWSSCISDQFGKSPPITVDLWHKVQTSYFWPLLFLKMWSRSPEILFHFKFSLSKWCNHFGKSLSDGSGDRMQDKWFFGKSQLILKTGSDSQKTIFLILVMYSCMVNVLNFRTLNAILFGHKFCFLCSCFLKILSGMANCVDSDQTALIRMPILSTTLLYEILGYLQFWDIYCKCDKNLSIGWTIQMSQNVSKHTFWRAPNEHSNQLAHPPCLISFIVCMKKLCTPGFPKSAQWSICSDLIWIFTEGAYWKVPFWHCGSHMHK